MSSEDLPSSLDDFFDNLARFTDDDSSEAVRKGLSDWEGRMGLSCLYVTTCWRKWVPSSPS